MKKSVLFVADWLVYGIVTVLAATGWASVILIAPEFEAMKQADPFSAGAVILAASVIVTEFTTRIVPVRNDLVARFVSLTFAWSLYNFGPSGFFTVAGVLVAVNMIYLLLTHKRQSVLVK